MIVYFVLLVICLNFIHFAFNSDEDSYGDDGGIMIDDEPDEVQAAYEEFLKMNAK